MANIIVGIGGIGLSNNSGDIVKTYALGSCVALIFLAPKIHAVGMAHIALPDSSLGNGKEKDMPGYFADTAIPAMIEEFKKQGVNNGRELFIKLAGGASIMDPNGTFNIGKRNVLALRKLLWKNRLGARAEDVGKDYSRTVWVEVDTGNVFISSPRKGTWQI